MSNVDQPSISIRFPEEAASEQDGDAADAEVTLPFAWPDLEHKQAGVPVQVRVGRAKLSQSGAQCPIAGRVFSLDRPLDHPVELIVNGQTIALGRLVMMKNKMAVKVTRLLNEQTRWAA